MNVGLPLRVTDFSLAAGTDPSVLKKIQASFVFIGIRNWDVSTYPTQSPVL